jgi:hypothetical protein
MDVVHHFPLPRAKMAAIMPPWNPTRIGSGGEAVKKKKKTFDAVAFTRKRREELSRAYAGLTAEQIEERIQQSLKDNPLWKKPWQGTSRRP